MSGLIIGKDKGVHDSDYYIEVTVVNKANLKTVVSKKVVLSAYAKLRSYEHVNFITE